MSKSYTCNYKGKAYNMTAKKWFEFLKDKPVFNHLSYCSMLNRLRDRKEKELTIAQCLGITEYDSKNPADKKNEGTSAPKNGEALYWVRNEFNRRCLI